MKLHFLASAALVLLSAVPGFAEKPSTAVAKPIESFNGVIEALIDEHAGPFGEEEFDAEKEQVSAAKGKSSRHTKRSSKSRRRRRRSSRRHRRYGKSSNRPTRRYRRYRRNMCRGRIRNRRDERTCDRIEDRYCSSRRDRSRNRSLCRRVGFGSVAEGAKEDAPETYAKDTEVFSEDTLADIGLVIGDIEDELEFEGSSEYSEDFDDEGSGDFDDEDSGDFDDEDSEDFSEDELNAYYRHRSSGRIARRGRQ